MTDDVNRKLDESRKGRARSAENIKDLEERLLKGPYGDELRRTMCPALPDEKSKENKKKLSGVYSYQPNTVDEIILPSTK